MNVITENSQVSLELTVSEALRIISELSIVVANVRASVGSDSFSQGVVIIANPDSAEETASPGRFCVFVEE